MSTFSVRTTPHFDRLAKRLTKRHPELVDHFAAMLSTLEADPNNQSRAHAIRKLTGVPPGKGQYRLRSGRWRFRYDIV